MIIDSHPAGVPSWIDLMTVDQDAAIAFYCDLFGWQAITAGPEMGNYTMCMKRGRPVAGIGQITAESPMPTAWRVYLNVDDADAVTAAAAAAGGQILAPVARVEGGGQNPGRRAILADPAGGVFGIWEPHDHLGSGLVNEPGSFAWNELLSRDPQASREFFRTVFGYEWERMPGAEGMEYYVASRGQGPIAGAMGMPKMVPADVPSYWNTYFGVSNADDTVAGALANGGSILGEVFDSPFGRMAVLADPQGASFSVVETPA